MRARQKQPHPSPSQAKRADSSLDKTDHPSPAGEEPQARGGGDVDKRSAEGGEETNDDLISIDDDGVSVTEMSGEVVASVNPPDKVSVGSAVDDEHALHETIKEGDTLHETIKEEVRKQEELSNACRL